MTRDDIIRMAQEARCDIAWANSLERFAALVVAAEREACAKVCEEMSGPIETYNPKYVYFLDCAAAIRARGE